MTWQIFASKALRIRSGLILTFLLTMLTACGSMTQIVERPVYRVLVWPKALSADCETPQFPPSPFKNPALLGEIGKRDKAIDDCNDQLRIGRDVEEAMLKEVEAINQRRSK